MAIKKFIKKVKNDNTESNKHWQYCKANLYPHIVIDEEDNYASVNYDILPCRPDFVDSKEIAYETELYKAILSLYKVYAERSNFEDGFMGGGISAAGIYVHKKDAKKLAELLFDFITSYIETVKDWEIAE